MSVDRTSAGRSTVVKTAAMMPRLPAIGWRALATSAASAMMDGKTAESINGNGGSPSWQKPTLWPSPRKPRLWLMQVEKKLLFRLNARRPSGKSRPSTRCLSTARGERMDTYKVVISPSTKWTRILVSHGPDEMLRAILPSPSETRNDRAAAVLLEGIALWLDTKLRVALSVRAGEAGYCLGLFPGVRSLFYEVAVVEAGARRRRGTRIQGVGDFGDLRQLRLVPDDGEL